MIASVRGRMYSRYTAARSGDRHREVRTLCTTTTRCPTATTRNTIALNETRPGIMTDNDRQRQCTKHYTKRDYESAIEAARGCKGSETTQRAKVHSGIPLGQKRKRGKWVVGLLMYKRVWMAGDGRRAETGPRTRVDARREWFPDPTGTLHHLVVKHPA